MAAGSRSDAARACVVLALAGCALAGAARAETAPGALPPYRLSARTDGALAAGAAVAGLGAILASGSPEPLTVGEIERLSPEDVNSFDRSATRRWSPAWADASDVAVGVGAAAPLTLFRDAGARGAWPTWILMYAETMSAAVILPAYGKGTVERIRPFVYNPAAPLGDKTTSDARKSFFSRHTSAAFASAVFLSTVYSEYHPASGARPFVWAGSLLAAGLVGIGRYEAGDHFPTGVIAGAAAGAAAGYLVPRLHRTGRAGVSLRPGCPGAAAGITLVLAR